VRGGSGSSSHPLTERELAVLELVAAGRNDAEVAALLRIAERTVAIHRSRILAKLGVTSREEAVAWARANGLLRDSGTAE
jgi:DNA-binding CsgD family transcriptional regulator